MATTRRPQIHTITTRGEQTTAVAMTPADLTELAEDIELLDLPRDRTGFMPLRGWWIHDTNGHNIGRVIASGSILTAEWLDTVDQNDWRMAKWGCRRLELGVAEILILRDETSRALAARTGRRITEWEEEMRRENEEWATAA